MRGGEGVVEKSPMMLAFVAVLEIGETFFEYEKNDVWCSKVTQVMKKSDLAIYWICLGALKMVPLSFFFAFFDKRVKKKKEEWWTDNLICSYPWAW